MTSPRSRAFLHSKTSRDVYAVVCLRLNEQGHESSSKQEAWESMLGYDRQVQLSRWEMAGLRVIGHEKTNST